jgi:flagellar assembly protein FliH
MPTLTSRTAAPYEAPVLQPVERVDPLDAAQLALEHARKDGFEVGYHAGMDLAQAEVTAAVARHDQESERLQRAALALEDAHRRLLAADRLVLEDIEVDVIELAIALATEIVGREVAASDAPVRDALARSLQLVPDRRTPTVVVHPDDLATARHAIDSDPRWGASIELVADGRVEPGGCVVEVGECRIDGQVGPALDRMRVALTV